MVFHWRKAHWELHSICLNCTYRQLFQSTDIMSFAFVYADLIFCTVETSYKTLELDSHNLICLIFLDLGFLFKAPFPLCQVRVHMWQYYSQTQISNVFRFWLCQWVHYNFEQKWSSVNPCWLLIDTSKLSLAPMNKYIYIYLYNNNIFQKVLVCVCYCKTTRGP